MLIHAYETWQVASNTLGDAIASPLFLSLLYSGKRMTINNDTCGVQFSFLNCFTSNPMTHGNQ